jgi:hypothetical protein
MPDYGHDLQFGCFLIPDAADPAAPERWVDVYTHLALEMGFSTFILIAEPNAEMLHTFIEDVAPRVRERVAERRIGEQIVQ